MKYFIALTITFFISSCISRQVTQKNHEKLEAMIQAQQDILIENQVFEDEIDFVEWVRPTLISQSVYQSTVKSSITFVNCSFEKPVKAFQKENAHITITSFTGNVTFINCQFKDEVSFRGSSIYGRVDFTGSRFDAPVSFEGSSFHEHAYFNKCSFFKEARFQNTTFLQKSSFMNSDFREWVSFQQSVFHDQLQFGVGVFYGYADFSLIDCRSNTMFNYAEFKDKADFSHSRFQGDVYLLNTQHTNSSFDHCQFMGTTELDLVKGKDRVSYEHAFFLLKEPGIKFVNKENKHQ